MSLRGLVDATLAALLAPACAACGDLLLRPLDGAVCVTCWSRVARFSPPLCERCGAPLHTARTTQSDGRCRRCSVDLQGVSCARAVGPFDGVMVEVVHALKYGKRPSVAPPLATLMRHAAGDLLREVDLVVPVPLHPIRERERGFNQAHLLAAGLGRPVSLALRRAVATAPQVALEGAARRGNVRGAFQLGRSAADVRGRTVALVDDVLTTGATLAACAEVLWHAQPLRIVALTAARADRAPHV